MRGVIVRDDDDVAVGIVAAEVTPVKRAANDDQRQRRGQGLRKETATRREARRHVGHCTEGARGCQRTTRHASSSDVTLSAVPPAMNAITIRSQSGR